MIADMLNPNKEIVRQIFHDEFAIMTRKQTSMNALENFDCSKNEKNANEHVKTERNDDRFFRY